MVEGMLSRTRFGALVVAALVLACLAAAPGAAAAPGTTLRITNVTDPIVRGAATNFTVQLVQADGTLDTAYRGRVHVTSTDPAAQLPPDYTFQASDAGQHNFSMNWINDGTHSLTVTDIADPTLSATYSGITVTKAVRLVMTTSDPVVRGVATSVTVSAVDFRGVPDPRYSGVVEFSSTDPAATLPAPYSFGQSDHGSHSFPAQLRWTTPGEQSLTVTDTVNAGFEATYTGIEVTRVSEYRLTQILDPVARNVPDAFTLEALDKYGTRDPLYRGTVRFTSTDPAATLPANYAFTSTDAGAHSFQVTWQTPGTHSLTATAATGIPLTITYSGITVTTTSNLTISSISDPIVRGQLTSLTVRALDSEGNPDGSYRGTVRFTSTDPAATLPANYTFTAADNGQHSFLFQLRWVTPGLRSITVRDTVNTAYRFTYAAIEVTQASRLQLVSVDDPIGRGAIDSFQVRALDPYDTVDPLFRDTVQFTSTDPGATLPPNHTYTATDNGQHAFQLSWATAGTQRLTVTDTAVPTIKGVKNGILVSTTAGLRMSGIVDPAVRGLRTGVTVTAVDASGATDGGYRGTVHFTSDDPAATLPPDYTFTATDAGRHTFAFVGAAVGVRWVTPGDHVLTVTDTAAATLRDTRTGITVTRAVALRLQNVQDPIPERANDQITVRAVDPFGTLDPLYTGTVRFTSDDPSAVLPADHTFTATDAGIRSFNVVWETPGNHQLAVQDLATASLADQRTGITVTALVGLRLEGLAEPLVRGSTDMFQVRAVDAEGRTATAYTGRVHFTSTDPAAVLPPDYTFVPGDNGVHTFSLTWTTAGDQDLTVTDTVVPSLTGTAADITITRAVRYAFVGIADPIARAVADPFTLRAVDQFGNVDRLYRGEVHFTASDPSATLPADYTFTAADNGQHAFSVTWATAGEASITATDTADNTVTTTRAAVTVT